MHKPKLFITGINGQIGRILQDGLADAYDIWGLDITGPFSDRVVRADIADYEQVLDAFQRSAPFPNLIHLAVADLEYDDWDPILRTNIIGTRNVFEAAREIGVEKVIFASSNHVTGAYEGFDYSRYQDPGFSPPLIRETVPIQPDSNYGVSKAFGEALARYYADRWGIPFICLRIGSVKEDDNPARDPRSRKTWLSHRDLVHLVRQSLLAEAPFGVYYGVSANTGAFWDITNARFELGYDPQDNAADYWDISEWMGIGWEWIRRALKKN